MWLVQELAKWVWLQLSVRVLATRVWLVPRSVQKLVPQLVLVSATQELLVLMWVRVLATRVWLVPPSVQKSVPQSVLVSATRELLVPMWVRVLATRVWVPPLVQKSVPKSVPRLVPRSTTQKLLVLTWVQVLATLVWVVPLSVPATLLWWDHHNTHPRTHRSCCMQYLLEERPCHRGIVQAPSLC